MLLTITTTHQPATDLGYLLHKNPANVQQGELSFGKAVMFYPEVAAERATFALILDIDPVALVRGKGASGATSGLIDQYVNDRPYAASSFLSVAIAKTLRNALGGSSKERPGLADTAIPLEARILPLPVRGSEGLVEKLFKPLGYKVGVEPISLDDTWPEWGASPYVALDLKATCRLRELLAHLYVLIPVLDARKHYFIDAQEIDKLLEKGAGWLAGHPERELIARRYMGPRRSLAREALSRLAEDEAENEEAEADAATAGEAAEGDVAPSVRDAAEEAIEKPLRLNDQRLMRVTEVLRAAGARRVVDLGCGSGKLLKRLLAERQFTEILGIDVSNQSLEMASRRLALQRLPERQQKRIALRQGALTYRDRRIEGYDAAALVEVIEHVDADRLPALERAVFEFARPETVVLTTPNREYNSRFEGMKPDALRHADHRFEWSREEFRRWAEPVAARFGYRVRFEGIGPVDEALGAPTQMAVFER
jgi:3' terminal RNA ribose 2'-O-methyltransferase Hen1